MSNNNIKTEYAKGQFNKLCHCNFCRGKTIGTDDFPWTCCIRDVEDKEESESESEDDDI